MKACDVPVGVCFSLDGEGCFLRIDSRHTDSAYFKSRPVALILEPLNCVGALPAFEITPFDHDTEVELYVAHS